LFEELLLQAASAKTLVEAVDTASGINNFLLTGVERVAGAANVQVDIFALGGVGLDNVTARAGSGHFGVFGMDTGFHLNKPQI
jgi:hypothetical protein